MTAQCAHPVALEMLVDYERAELSLPESDELEAHLFECDSCSQRLEDLALIARHVPDVVERGLVLLFLTRSLEDRLRAEGTRTRVFHLEPGTSVPCGAAPADDLTIMHLAADLTGVTRARLTLNDDAGLFDFRNDDIPVEAGGDMVRLAIPAELVRGLPDMAIHVRLALELDGREPRSMEYTLLHSHAGPPTS